MDPSTIESWWEKEYKNYSIKDMSGNLFIKLSSFTKPFDGHMKNIYEKFTDDNINKIYYWKDTKTSKAQKTTYNIERNSYLFEDWDSVEEKLQDNKVVHAEIEEFSYFDQFEESGSILKKYDDHVQKTTWKISNHQENSQVHEIVMEGIRESPKGPVKFYEKLKKNPTITEKKYVYKRNSREVDIDQFEEPNYSTFKRHVTDEDLEKTTEITNHNGKVTMKKMIYFRGLFTSIFQEKFEDSSFSQEISECQGKTVGKIFFSNSKNSYQLNWVFTNKQVKGSIKVLSGDSKKITKIWRFSRGGLIEISDFQIGEYNWGVIKEETLKNSLCVEWTKTKPEVYKEIENKISIKNYFEYCDSIIEKEEIQKDIIQEANFLFETIERLDVYEWVAYESMIRDIFKPTIVLDREFYHEIGENISEIVEKNKVLANSLLEGQSAEHFEGLIFDAEMLKKISIDLPEICEEFQNITSVFNSLVVVL